MCRCGHHFREHIDGGACAHLNLGANGHQFCECNEWVGVHYHIETRSPHTEMWNYHGCYNISGRMTIETEAARLGGRMLVVLDTDCPNGMKPEYIAWKRR
jgi:hypothetical protein